MKVCSLIEREKTAQGGAKASPTPLRKEREERKHRKMTTAARPTWAPAKGSEDQGGSRMFGPRSGYSSKDAVAHTEMKARQDGQDAAGELE